MIPLRDENPTRTTPVVTITLIIDNIVVFIYQLLLGIPRSTWQVGLIPAELMGAPPPEIDPRLLLLGRLNLEPAWATILTSMFMHGNWLHILGNMWYLWIFGNNVEDEMGKGRFIGFYLLCGVGAALAQVFTGPLTGGFSPIPMVGASGAVAGVLGAYLALHPHSKVHTLIVMILITHLMLPAWVVLGFWLLLQVISGIGAFGMNPASGGVAYAAHIGGFVLGWIGARVLLGARRDPPTPQTPRPGFMDEWS